MNYKNKIAVLILTIFVFSLSKIAIVKSDSCDSQSSNTCPTDTCKIECGETFIRNLTLDQKHYYNFTITRPMYVALTLRNVTINNSFNLFVAWNATYCPYHTRLDDSSNALAKDQCSAIGPPPLLFCTNGSLPNPPLPPGNYYFAVSHRLWTGLGDNNAPYNLSLTCIVRSELGTFCCGPPSGKKCYNSGVCCLMTTESEYWHPTGCFGFNAWVQPDRMMFTLGSKTPVNLYIQNKGAYTDSYTVNADSSNPELIKYDLTGVSPTGGVAYGEIKTLYPRIITLYNDIPGNVKFNVSSQGDPTLHNITTLNIIASDFPLSLPEFGILGLIEIIILAGIVYLVVSEFKK